MSEVGSGYPSRELVVLAAALALVLILRVLPLAPTTGLLAAGVAVAACCVVAWWTLRLRRARQRNAGIMHALGMVTADLPRSLRTQMPLFLVVGDGLAQLFSTGDGDWPVHVGDGAIWVGVTQPRDLSRLALVLRQWRDGRAPDAIVLALAPALHPDPQALAHALRLVRQTSADTARLLGARIPGYLALYQRLTGVGHGQDAAAPLWYGVAQPQPIGDAAVFEDVMQRIEGQAQRAHAEAAPAWRAAALPNLIHWTNSVVLAALRDRNQPAPVWPLFGIAWIDCGPAAAAHAPWNRHVRECTHLTPPPYPATQGRWPLPQALLAALPRRAWMSPRVRGLAHALTLTLGALALAGWASAHNNHALLAQAGEKLTRFASIPATNDAARRDALAELTIERDRLESYQRTGLPLNLSFGMYRGAALLPALNAAIASYQAPTPVIVTLDSMSLFASGSARLKPGSTRALVAALDMIKTHPNNRILVAGHTDNIGDPGSNQRLSVARADAVRDWLTEAADMAPSRFALQGYGDSRPIADNQTETGRARNRRVEIILVPDSPGT